LLYIDIKFDNKCFRLVNIYAHVVSQDRDSFLFDLVKYFVTSSELILVGDFNFINNSKLYKINGNLDKHFSSCKIFNNISRTYSLIDTFRYLFPHKKLVTWYRRCSNYGLIGCRLDRIYVSINIITNICCSGIKPWDFSDHDVTFISIKLDNILSVGKSYWKFNNSLLKDDDFYTYLEYYLKVLTQSADVSLQWWDDVKMTLNVFCLDYSKEKNGLLYKEYRSLITKYQQSSCLLEKESI